MNPRSFFESFYMSIEFFFKNSILLHLLMLGSLLLSACTDENPLTEPRFQSLYVGQFENSLNEKKRLDYQLTHYKYGHCVGCFQRPTQAQLSRIHGNATCPYYFSTPRVYPERKKFCEVWIKETQAWFQHDQQVYADNHDKKLVILTDDNMKDPQFWSVIVQAMEAYHAHEIN